MADSHQNWLEKMEVESRAKQQTFINGIAAKLKRPRVTEKPVHPFRGAPDFWKGFELGDEERIERFTENFINAGGHVARLADLDEAKRFITEKAAELGAKYVIRQNEAELESLNLEGSLAADVSVWNSKPEAKWKARAAEADLGIVFADHAVAHTGSVAVLSSANKGRAVSLLPTALIVIVPVDRIKTRLGEILVRLDDGGREKLPAGVHFISGPSRSSDIENDLTIGVHGPGVVFALLVGE
jgi:L-lactate dehydrogenase complex protein LldG